MKVADILKEWRRADALGHGDFTQIEAAAHLGIPLGTYKDYEQGRSGPKGLALSSLLQLIRSKPKGIK